MPVLDYRLIPNLKFIKGADNKYLLLDNFEHREIQKAEQQQYIQGSIGTQIMNIDGIYWTCNLSAPIFIFEKQNDLIDSPLSLIWDALNNRPLFRLYSNPILGVTTNAIMQEGSIKILNTGINASISVISDADLTSQVFKVTNDNIFQREDLIHGNTTTIGRTAQRYDTKMQIGSTGTHIISGQIDFRTTVKTDWFINDVYPPLPCFSVHGFTISGNLNIAYVPEIIGTKSIAMQQQNQMTITEQSIKLYVGKFWLEFNDAKLIFSDITKSLTMDGIVTAELKFESFSPTILLS